MIGRYLLAAVLILSMLGTERMGRVTRAESMQNQQQLTVRLTWYQWTGSPTYSGIWPVEGWTVACSWDFPLGQWIEIDGERRQCLDRGHLYERHIDWYCETESCVEWVRQRPVALATIGGGE